MPQPSCPGGFAEAGFAAPVGLTAAGYRAKSISILVRKDELAELREQIKYELRRGNITAEKAASLSVLIDEINLEGNAAKLQAARPATACCQSPGSGPFWRGSHAGRGGTGCHQQEDPDG